MTRAVVVRYQARNAEAGARNEELIEQVFAELNAEDPGGMRYAAFRLADGVSFVHVAVFSGPADPLSESKAFREFQRDIGERLDGAPIVSPAALIGSYGWSKPAASEAAARS